MCDNKETIEKLKLETDIAFHQYRIKKAESEIAFHKKKLGELENE